MKRFTMFAVGMVVLGPEVCADPFLNLDFESVKQPISLFDPPLNLYAAASDAIPGWTASQNNIPIDTVYYNAVTLGSGSVNLFSTFQPRGTYGAQFVMNGKYAVGLQNGFGLAALSQTGTIPTGSQTMLFDCMGDKFFVGFDGSLAPVIYLGQSTSASGVKFDTFGVNVSSLAGQDVQLSFSSSPENSGVIFDNIRFSPHPAVPEPSTYALAICGGVMVVVCSVRRIKGT